MKARPSQATRRALPHRGGNLTDRRGWDNTAGGPGTRTRGRDTIRRQTALKIGWVFQGGHGGKALPHPAPRIASARGGSRCPLVFCRNYGLGSWRSLSPPTAKFPPPFFQTQKSPVSFPFYTLCSAQRSVCMQEGPPD